MKHYILTFLCLFLSKSSFSQFDVSLSSLSGYESNILRAPDRFLDGNELIEADELYKNSFFQDVIANLKYKREARKSVFKISAKLQKRFYFSEAESNRLLADFKLGYKLDLTKSSSWENTAQYYIKDQNGLDADENEIGGSFSYNVFNVDSRFNFRLYKSNRSFIGGHYGKKSFTATETREVSYHKYGITAGFKDVKWNNHLLRSFGVNTSFIQRKYDIEAIDEDDEFTIENRIWNHLEARVFYKMELTKAWTIYPSLTYEKRIDQSDSKFGYNEFTPKLYISYSGKNIESSLSASYTKRNFTDLTVNDNDLLTYDYLRFKWNLSYKLSRQWSIISQAYIIDRKSNNDNLGATTFRSYNSYYAGIGLRFSL